MAQRDPQIENAYRIPLEAFPGLTQRRTILNALPVSKYSIFRHVSNVKARRAIEIAKIQTALEQMHRNISVGNGRERWYARERHNRQTNDQPANFTVGDFVLVRRAKNKGHKLSFFLRGPISVFGVESDFVFEV